MSLEHEVSLLNAILHENSTLAQVDLTPEQFSLQYRPVFQAMLDLSGSQTPIDPITLKDKMGEIYLPVIVEILDDFGVPANATAYADIIKRDHRKASARAAAEKLLQDGDVDKAIQDLMSIHKTEQKYNSTIKESLENVVQKLSNPEDLKGFPTGIGSLDHKLGGFHRGDLHIVGARPSVGKTAIMLNFLRASREAGLVVSGEQDDFQIALRMLTTESDVPLWKLRSGNLEDSDWSRLTHGMSQLKDLPIYFYDKPAPTLLDIQREARKHVYEHGITMLFVDYLQRMHPADPRVPRHQQVEWDVKGMKEIARELNIAVVCLAQVKRDVDNRDGEDRLPRMSDLGDSGSIEREADVILTLYREHAYGKPVDGNGRPLNIPDNGLLGVVKNRHGLNGEVPIQYIGDRLQFLERT